MSGLRLSWKKFSRDRLAFTGFLIIVSLVLTALLAGVLSPYPEDTHKIHPASRLKAPSMKYLLGTDHMGRDILSRLLHGARVTLIIAIIAVATSLLIGVPLGLIAGYLENWVSELIMRIADIFLSIPQVILALFMAKTLGPSIPNVIVAFPLPSGPGFPELSLPKRGATKSVFIEATEAVGANPLRIILLHILPNVSSSIIVRSSIGMGYTILTAAVLGFSGWERSPRPRSGGSPLPSRGSTCPMRGGMRPFRALPFFWWFWGSTCWETD